MRGLREAPIAKFRKRAHKIFKTFTNGKYSPVANSQ